MCLEYDRAAGGERGYGISSCNREGQGKITCPKNSNRTNGNLHLPQSRLRKRLALGLSRVKVVRILAAARNEGIVRIGIDARSARQAALERGLVTVFGLDEAIVVPAARDAANVPALVGYAAGLWLSDMLKDS